MAPFSSCLQSFPVLRRAYLTAGFSLQFVLRLSVYDNFRCTAFRGLLTKNNSLLVHCTFSFLPILISSLVVVSTLTCCVIPRILSLDTHTRAVRCPSVPLSSKRSVLSCSDRFGSSLSIKQSLCCSPSSPTYRFHK